MYSPKLRLALGLLFARKKTIDLKFHIFKLHILKFLVLLDILYNCVCFCIFFFFIFYFVCVLLPLLLCLLGLLGIFGVLRRFVVVFRYRFDFDGVWIATETETELMLLATLLAPSAPSRDQTLDARPLSLSLFVSFSQWPHCRRRWRCCGSCCWLLCMQKPNKKQKTMGLRRGLSERDVGRLGRWETRRTLFQFKCAHAHTLANAGSDANLAKNFQLRSSYVCSAVGVDAAAYTIIVAHSRTQNFFSQSHSPPCLVLFCAGLPPAKNSHGHKNM